MTGVLLIVGEALVAYQRDLGLDGLGAVEYTGPWASGAPAITSYVAARLGVETHFVGGIGADEHGREIRRRLSAAGVHLDHLQVNDALPTATAHITYRGPDRREFVFNVEGTAATAVRDVGDLPERAKWVHLSGSALLFGEPLASTALAALDRARRAGARTSVDPNVRPEALTDDLRLALIDAVRRADVVLPSEGELEVLGLDIAELLATGAVVCTTLGPAGAEVRDPQGGVTRLPAIKVRAVDTDGAGDSFAGGFVAAALNGADPVTAALAGLTSAARAVVVDGPMTVEFGPNALDDLR
jgi:sugar/nucleoside kinase (ribokinase family)